MKATQESSQAVFISRLVGYLLVVAWLTICLIPFRFLHPESWLLDPYPWDYMLVMALACVTAFLIVSDFSSFGRKPVFIYLTLAYLGALTVSCFGSQDMMRSWMATTGFIFRGVIPCMAAWCFTQRRSGHLIDKSVLLLGCLLGAIAVFEVSAGRFFLVKIDPYDSERVASFWMNGLGYAIGAMGQPLPLSFLAVMLLPFSVWRFFKSKKAVDVVWVIPVLTCIVLTYRRTAYLAVLLILAGALMAPKKINRRFLLVLLIPLVLVVGAALTKRGRQVLGQRFSPVSTLHELKTGPRTQAFVTSYRMFKSAPLLGIGHRMYEVRSKEFNPDPINLPTPDSQLLRTMAEGGLLGLFTLALLVLFPVVRFARAGTETWFPWIAMNVLFVLYLPLIEGLSWPTTLMTFFILNGTGLALLDKTERGVLQ